MTTGWQRGHFPNSDCCTEVENISSDHPHPPDPAAFPFPQTCFATKLGRHHSAAGGESTEGGDSEICWSANSLFNNRILRKVYVIWYRITKPMCSVPFWSFWSHCDCKLLRCVIIHIKGKKFSKSESESLSLFIVVSKLEKIIHPSCCPPESWFFLEKFQIRLHHQAEVSLWYSLPSLSPFPRLNQGAS